MQNSDFQKNQQAWNHKVPLHFKSDFYDLAAFRKGASSLKSPELALLGNVESKEIIHLQCHFGQDTLSLVRMGAKVCGLDFSDTAIEQAKSLSQELGLTADFVCANVLEIPESLHAKFDTVFTSYGVLLWLPNLKEWAKSVRKCLKPGGELVLVEFHPVVWMFDDDFQKVAYFYHNEKKYVESYTGTYADRADAQTFETVFWNHGLDEVLMSLLGEGFEIIHFEEFNWSPWPCFSRQTEVEPGKFQIPDFEGKIPMMFSLKARLK